MISALIKGELASDPTERTTANGARFWTANVRVSAGPETLFVSLTTFSESAGERLAVLRKGSALAATGTLEQTAWVGKDGASRGGWRLTAGEILTVYAASKKRKAGAPADPLKDSRSVTRLWASDGGELPESDL
jgi:single-stranded DNA-binding protein